MAARKSRPLLRFPGIWLARFSVGQISGILPGVGAVQLGGCAGKHAMLPGLSARGVADNGAECAADLPYGQPGHPTSSSPPPVHLLARVPLAGHTWALFQVISGVRYEHRRGP
jgi:hypothetical protein